MIKQYPTAPTTIALALLLTSVTVLAGCADTADNTQSNQDFEIRSMIAADRQQMQSMDERLRRLEGEIQDLAHNSAPPATISSAPAAPAPPAAAAPETPPAQVGAPPAPGGAMPPNAVAPGAMTVPPGAAASPTGAPAEAAGAGEAAAAPGVPAEGASAPESAPEASAPGGSEGGTIAGAPGESGAAAPSAEENTPENNGPPASAEEGNDDNGNDEGAAQSNPEAQPPQDENANAGEPAEGGAAAPGEVIASMPPASTPENAPAAVPVARWPEDLTRELQSSSSATGAAGKVFRSGLEAMQSRNYSTAVDRFGYLQKKYPHSDLTEPAAYFSASALNELGKYDQAILQYNDLVMRYPKGKYAGEAMLREAQDFVQINDKVDARLTLQKLINDYPGTPQAATANAMMKNLDSE
jgi:tol-pal system protein YbgF